MLVHKKYSVLAACLLAAAFSFAAAGPFTPDAYLRHIQYLASDDLQGRGNGTPELNRAADYIAGQFASAGIQPAGDDGTFFQKFMIATGSRLGPGNTLTFTSSGNPITATLGRDFVPFGAGEKTSLSGEVVFAGYGISSDENKYDDYNGPGRYRQDRAGDGARTARKRPGEPVQRRRTDAARRRQHQGAEREVPECACNPHRAGPGEPRGCGQGSACARGRGPDRRTWHQRLPNLPGPRTAAPRCAGQEPRGVAETDRRDPGAPELRAGRRSGRASRWISSPCARRCATWSAPSPEPTLPLGPKRS